MCNQNDKSIHGIKVKNFNVVMTVLAIGLCVLVLISSFKIKSKYSQTVASVTDYSDCTKAVNELRDASDFLTNQARLFSINQEQEFLDNYFKESLSLQRREVAVEIVKMSHENDSTVINLEKAYNESVELQKTELYSLKLVSEAINLQENVPEELQEVSLSAEDKALSADAKIKKAQKMLCDTEYLHAKDRIYKYTKTSLNDLIDTYLGIQQENDTSIKTALDKELVYIISLIIVSIFLFIFLMLFVLTPLEFHIDSILRNIKMKEKGSYELRYIAKAYNNLCDKNEVKASVLKHKAEHDPLTGLINRNAFDQIKEAFAGADEPIAYLIIDIDFFKKINDDYGHPIGDEILKKIASLLMETFRQTDYVARIGGDEFAVIMTKFGTSAIEIIQKKIDGLNYTLQSVADGLPSVSLSVGVAFSEKGYHPDLVEQADKALYRVKRGGRCNCSFYKGEE